MALNHTELAIQALYIVGAIVIAHLICVLIDALFMDSAKDKIVEKMADKG